MIKIYCGRSRNDGARKLAKLVLLCLLLFGNTQTFAAKNYFNMSSAELKMLPGFCRNGFGGLGISKNEIVWLNHFCPGLNALNHAKTSYGNSIEKQYALQRAESHLSYTLTHMKSTFFQAYLYLKRGEVRKMSGDMGKAIVDYTSALKYGPKKMVIYTA